MIHTLKFTSEQLVQIEGALESLQTEIEQSLWETVEDEGATDENIEECMSELGSIKVTLHTIQASLKDERVNWGAGVGQPKEDEQIQKVVDDQIKKVVDPVTGKVQCPRKKAK